MLGLQEMETNDIGNVQQSFGKTMSLARGGLSKLLVLVARLDIDLPRSTCVRGRGANPMQGW